MKKNRLARLNSLLKEVLSEVIRKEVRNPHISPLTTITNVDITQDLHHAKVSVSVIGNDKEKKETLRALESAASFIALQSSKKISIRFFPALSFILDTSVDKQVKIEQILQDIHQEQESRQKPKEE